MTNQYDPILKRMPETEHRREITFRVAGDGFLQVKYGTAKLSTQKTLKEIIFDAFRVIIVNDKVKKAKIKGVTETVPGAESLLCLFDPLQISHYELVEELSKIESQVNSIEDYTIDTRILRLPLTFEDSEVSRSIDKYVKEIKPDAINCKDGSNLQYIADYNGITVQEVKDMFLKTEWLVAMVGFFPGLPYFYPLNPTCAITAPKYNPARTWTPEGTVDLADFCATIFGVESSGGYQLIGRTVPIFQANQKHKAYAESPALIKPTDLIQFYEATEEEVNDIYTKVHEKGEWDYDIQYKKFSLKEWVNMYNELEPEAMKLREKQEQGRKNTPLP